MDFSFNSPGRRRTGAADCRFRGGGGPRSLNGEEKGSDFGLRRGLGASGSEGEENDVEEDDENGRDDGRDERMAQTNDEDGSMSRRYTRGADVLRYLRIMAAVVSVVVFELRTWTTSRVDFEISLIDAANHVTTYRQSNTLHTRNSQATGCRRIL